MDMKTKLHAVLVVISVVALAGCASSTGLASQQGVQKAHHSQGRMVADAEYVAYVERKALSRGVDVHWVNQPVRVAETGDE